MAKMLDLKIYNMVRASIFGFLLFMWVLLMVPPVTLMHALKRKAQRARLIEFACKGVLAILNVHVKVVGELSAARPLLLVSNHVSYMDIPIIASVIEARFTPKSEIARWPLIGYCCKLFDCIFIDRNPKQIAKGQEDLSTALAEGSIVSLFPEATTGDGIHLLPFKPAFFDVAVAAEGMPPVVVQPVAILYKTISGLPIDSSQWPSVAWYGDMTLLPHMLGMLVMGRIGVELHLLPPITPQMGQDRKQLAALAQQAVSECLSG